MSAADVIKVRLRPTMSSDLDFVLSVEQDPLNRPFITPWERTQHEGAIRFPDSRHFIRAGIRKNTKKGVMSVNRRGP